MKVLVTGTSRGLGLAIATGLVDAGCQVIGCARGKPPNGAEIFEHIDGVDFLVPDTFSRLQPTFGDCDALINNVGIAFDGLLATQAETSIDQIIRTNLTNTLILTKRYVRERLRVRRRGIIINISSIIGIRGYSGLAAYSASKAGIDGMTRALARELGPKGFRVNSILPGYMETDMSRALTPAQKEQIVRRTPLGRLATVGDVSGVIAFFLSDNAAFITGQSVVVDGGITV
jgi:3-oxoacyl-[acyl-carrier protein] reductase